MVITFKAESISALKAISEPLELVVLRVIKPSTLELVNAELSVFLIEVLKLRVIFEETPIPVAEFAGTNVIQGVREFAILPLPNVVLPPIVIVRQFVDHMPESLITKLLSIAIALVDCDAPSSPLRITS